MLLAADRPECIEIARSLTTTVAHSSSRAAIRAAAAFARASGAAVIAEGVESEFVAAQMVAMGVGLGQETWLGRPASLAGDTRQRELMGIAGARGRSPRSADQVSPAASPAGPRRSGHGATPTRCGMTATPTCEQECQPMAEITGAIRAEREGAVALVTIVHPPVNAISRGVAAGILEALTAAEDDPDCRALIVTGEGERYFSAGADLTEFPGGAAGGVAGSDEVTRRLEASRLPVVAAVNGIAYGGGCEIALACDLRICTEDARFGQPEIKLGIMPGWGGTQRLPRLVGRGPALEMLLTGDPIGAARALEWGLVTQVVPPDRLREEALALAGLLAQRPPLAVAAIKRAVHRGLDGALDAGLRREQEEFGRLLGSEDAGEGLSAFLEKRPPTWRGR